MGDEHLITGTQRIGDSRSVIEFVADMLEKLEANSHKEHWSKVDFDYLFMRLKEEVDELEEAADKSADEIISECADVANFAMMIADNVRNWG